MLIWEKKEEEEEDVEEEKEKNEKKDAMPQQLRLWASDLKVGSSDSPNCYFWALEQGLTTQLHCRSLCTKKKNLLSAWNVQKVLEGVWG